MQPGQDVRLQDFLVDGEDVIAAVRVRLVVHAAASSDLKLDARADAPMYLLAITDTRLVSVGLAEDGSADLDASIPITYLAGVRHEAYDAVDELVVSLTTGATVRFEVPIGHEHSAREFADYVHTLAPTQVIPAVAAGPDALPPVPDYEPSLRDATATPAYVSAAGAEVAAATTDAVAQGAADDGAALHANQTTDGDELGHHSDADDRPDLVSSPDPYFLRVVSETDDVEAGECPHCLGVNSPGAVFCRQCGTAL